MRHVLPEERVTFSHRWILPLTWTHYLSVLLHALNKTALIWQEVPLKSASTHHYGDEAAQRSKNLSLAWLHRVLAGKIHIHDAKPSPLTTVHGFTKRLQGYVSVAGRFWRRRLYFWVSHSTGLEGEMQQESVTQCFLGLFFSPSPSVLSIFNVYGFYLSWHRQQPLWHCRYCRFSVRLRLDPDCLMQSTREKCCMWCNTATVTRSGGGHKPVFIPGEQHFPRRLTQ